MERRCASVGPLMRNLVEYPITSEEVVQLLRQLATTAMVENRDSYGDMTVLLLATAAEVVETADSLLKAVDKRLKGEPPLKYVTPWKEATELIKAFNSQNPPKAS